ncbi:hypothetical protein LIER_38325 [Lithospermum erythrorhizon]|uniref:Uncharacterized protein n=1 Tax=Lithospermum erythrorhizon TaxID=34254 RepID=A0AAV3PZY9_LITER
MAGDEDARAPPLPPPEGGRMTAPPGLGFKNSITTFMQNPNPLPPPHNTTTLSSPTSAPAQPTPTNTAPAQKPVFISSMQNPSKENTTAMPLNPANTTPAHNSSKNSRPESPALQQATTLITSASDIAHVPPTIVSQPPKSSHINSTIATHVPPVSSSSYISQAPPNSHGGLCDPHCNPAQPFGPSTKYQAYTICLEKPIVTSRGRCNLTASTSEVIDNAIGGQSASYTHEILAGGPVRNAQASTRGSHKNATTLFSKPPIPQPENSINVPTLFMLKPPPLVTHCLRRWSDMIAKILIT